MTPKQELIHRRRETKALRKVTNDRGAIAREVERRIRAVIHLDTILCEMVRNGEI